ncbi:hypothetical protein BRC86_12820 [Halobacteriales archaeon QS_3_64_16]|nr:MAG: hypothetical protein BRC86_12820 [Halobacteriales archaeon QS_3_64_16]
MSSLDEKRVHDPNTEPERAVVASDTGTALCSIAGGRLGSASLVHRAVAADAATDGERIVLASEEAVLELDGGVIEELGYGPASAVSIDDRGRVLAAGEGGLARLEDGEWHSIRPVGPNGPAGEIRAIEGDLLASTAGVYRITSGELRYSGLGAARDVTSVGTPRAATDTGLYALGNGWLEEHNGEFSMIGADPEPSSPGALGRAHAAGLGGLYEHVEAGWQRRAVPTEERVVDVAYGETTYAVTEDGTLLIADDGKGNERWRTHPLGLQGVRALAITPR